MKQITEPDSAALAASASLKATVTGGGILSLGGLTSNDLAVLGGIVIALAGFILQMIFQRRRDRREAERRAEERLEHLARLEAIKEACSLDGRH